MSRVARFPGSLSLRCLSAACATRRTAAHARINSLILTLSPAACVSPAEGSPLPVQTSPPRRQPTKATGLFPWGLSAEEVVRALESSRSGEVTCSGLLFGDKTDAVVANRDQMALNQSRKKGFCVVDTGRTPDALPLTNNGWLTLTVSRTRRNRGKVRSTWRNRRSTSNLPTPVWGFLSGHHPAELRRISR